MIVELMATILMLMKKEKPFLPVLAAILLLISSASSSCRTGLVDSSSRSSSVKNQTQSVIPTRDLTAKFYRRVEGAPAAEEAYFVEIYNSNSGPVKIKDLKVRGNSCNGRVLIKVYSYSDGEIIVIKQGKTTLKLLLDQSAFKLIENQQCPPTNDMWIAAARKEIVFTASYVEPSSYSISFFGKFERSQTSHIFPFGH